MEKEIWGRVRQETRGMWWWLEGRVNKEVCSGESNDKEIEAEKMKSGAEKKSNKKTWDAKENCHNEVRKIVWNEGEGRDNNTHTRRQPVISARAAALLTVLWSTWDTKWTSFQACQRVSSVTVTDLMPRVVLCLSSCYFLQFLMVITPDVRSAQAARYIPLYSYLSLNFPWMSLQQKLFFLFRI